MKALVIGGTGTTGSRVVRSLLKRGVEVSVMTRSAEKVVNGARMVIGDLRDPNTSELAFRGIDLVFMLVAAGVSETYEGVLGVLLGERAKVRRFVYMSSQKIDLTPTLIFGGATKLPIENALELSGIAYTILRPNSFYQNDIWYKTALLDHGVYPQPFGLKGMQRVDVADIAEVAAVALTEAGHEGRTYNLVGPEIQTGPSIAESWSRALGRKIVYGGDDLDVFENSHAFMGPQLVFPYRLLFDWYQKHGLHGSPEDLEMMTRLLRRPPRSHASFAKEMAKEWTIS